MLHRKMYRSVTKVINTSRVLRKCQVSIKKKIPYSYTLNINARILHTDTYTFLCYSPRKFPSNRSGYVILVTSLRSYERKFMICSL